MNIDLHFRYTLNKFEYEKAGLKINLNYPYLF